MSAIIGIDPGRTGWLVAVDSDGIAWSEPMPETTRGLSEILRRHAESVVCVEEQSIRARQAYQGAIMASYGAILGILITLDVRHEVVPPKNWQKAMMKGCPKVRGSDALKREYVSVAERLWPTISFRGPRGGMLDGKAAAALIAEYGRRMMFGS